MINQLVSKIQKTGAPIVVGLDPMMKFVPEHIQKKAFSEYGETLEGAAEAIWQYNKGIVDAVYDLIPAVKPQIAMYEQFGIPGLQAFKKTVDYCKEKGLVVIGDIKRGDIGSTSTAYAVGHLGKVQVGSNQFSGFDEDFVTVNPYLGSDGVKPFIDVCKEEKKGIFVLVKTSNPSSGEFQDRLIDGKPLYELVGAMVDQWGSEVMGDTYSYVGAVVGATYPEMGKVLREIMPKAYILVPGYGAQGGKGKDLVHFFNQDGLGAIVNSSRGMGEGYVKMDGSKVFRFATGALAQAVKETLEEAQKTIDDIDYIVCHQANERIIRHVQKKYPGNEHKFYINIDRYGNTSSASIPIALDEMKEQEILKPGMQVVCVGFGAGLTWSGALIEV